MTTEESNVKQGWQVTIVLIFLVLCLFLSCNYRLYVDRKFEEFKLQQMEKK